MKATFTPYLNFNGNFKEAMQFYQSILGGELEMQTFGEAPVESSEKLRDRIMHATLKNDAITFMASDNPTEHRATINNSKVHLDVSVHLSITGSDENLLTKYFNGLAEGGKVDMPLAKQFWGDTFGILTDKFGVHWMVNISSEEQKQ